MSSPVAPPPSAPTKLVVARTRPPGMAELAASPTQNNDASVNAWATGTLGYIRAMQQDKAAEDRARAFSGQAIH